MIHTDQTTIKSIQKVIHTGVKCDICGAYPIQGYRYKCSICSNWDCCSKCESKHDHPLIQFKKHNANSTNTKNISDDNKHTTECLCICGTKMKYIQSNVAYKNGNSIVCDGCRVSVSGAMRVYHCPNETNTSHRGGYDLCVSCSNKRMLNSKKSTAINTKINVGLINDIPNNIIECTGNDVTQCASYHRLLTTMSKYDTETNHNKYDHENNKWILNDFLHLLSEHNIDSNDQQFEIITNSLGCCNINTCDIFARNYRDRSKTIISTIDETEPVQERVWREIFDRIHCHFAHCVDIGNRISLKKKQSLHLEQKDDDAENVCLVDKLMKERYNIIKTCNNNTIKNNNTFNNRMKMKFIQFNEKSDEIKDENIQLTAGMYSFGTKFNYGYARETWDKNGVIVKQKYSSLKEELTTNKISAISLKQFMTETQKAILHFNAEYCKKKFNSDFVLECALALMIYCNYDVLQYEFSKTYRDNINKHNNYYHLGKYLKMAITLNGTRCTIENIRKPFFHGIGEQLLFPTYVGSKAKGVLIYGPLSTSTSFDVATNFTNGNNGLIIQFGYKKVNYNQSPRHFSVAFLSDFSNESENLFIQSNNVSMKIQNIFDVKQGCQFEPIINALTIIEEITTTGIFYGGMGRMANNIPKRMKKFVSKILRNQLSKSLFSDLTEYANKMIQTYMTNKKSIHIDYTKLNSKYSFVKDIFCYEKCKWIKINEIKIIFPNIECISLNGFQTLCSVKMNDIVNNLKTNNKIATVWNIPYNFKHKLEYVEMMNTIYGNKPFEFMQVLNALKIFDDILHRKLENISLEMNKLIIQILNSQISQLSKSNESFCNFSEDLMQIIETFFQYKTSIAINCNQIKTKCSFLIGLLFENDFDCIRFQEIMTIFPNLKEITMYNVHLKLQVLDNIVTFLSNNNKLEKMIIYNTKSSECSPQYVQHLYQEQLSKIDCDIQVLFSQNIPFGITIKTLKK